jgi:hypothetical protein
MTVLTKETVSEFAQQVADESLRWSLQMIDLCDEQPDPNYAQGILLAAMVQMVRSLLDVRPEHERVGWLKTLSVAGVGLEHLNEH